MKKLRRRSSAEGGQAILEYIILLSIVLVSIAYFLKKLSNGFDNMTANTGGKLERQLRTGSAPPGIWKNPTK